LDSKDNTPTPQSQSAAIIGEDSAVGQQTLYQLSNNLENKPDSGVNVGSPEDISEKKVLTPGMMSSGYSSTVCLEDVTTQQRSDVVTENGDGSTLDDVDQATNANLSCLIDSAIPADLGSPLKPSTPYRDAQIAEELENNNNRTIAAELCSSSETDASKNDLQARDSSEFNGVKFSNHVNKVEDCTSAEDVDITDLRTSTVDADRQNLSLTASDVAATNHPDSVLEHHSGESDGERCADSMPAIVKLPPASTSAKLKLRHAEKSSDKPANVPVKATYRPPQIPTETVLEEDRGQSFGSQEEVTEQGVQ